jgi:outer membrane receptor for ferrienterochelin and colicins
MWLDLGYGLTHAVDLDASRLLEGRSMHRITGRLSGRIRPVGVEASVRAAWNGPRWFYPELDGDGIADAFHAPAYVDLDARLARRIFTRYELFLGIKNALDAGDPTYLPLPPRQVYGGVSVEL